MPLQIKRHLVILIILVVSFIAIRQFMMPGSFGELGHYRASSLQDNENKDIKYAGKASCAECHEDQVDLIEMDLHTDLSCESCHGPGMAHTIEPDTGQMILPESRESCAVCHSRNPARKTKMVYQVDINEHNAGKKCTYCHNPHAPWELRNQETQEENF